MPGTDQLTAQLDRIAAIDTGPYPVISLYLNLQPDQHGRDNVDSFLRRELGDRIGTYASSGPERESLEKDAEKIRDAVASLPASANGAAIFACSSADLFDVIPLAAPIDEHRLYVSDQPHVYPLARLIDEYPRYAVLLADTNSASIFVVAAGELEDTQRIEGTKTRGHKMGGWSQARYQRRIENFHLKHAKEVIDALGRLVTKEGIKSIVVAGDEVVVPLLRDQMPKELSGRVVDILRLDIRASAREVLEAAITAMRQKDAETDRERVDALLGAYRGNGLAVVGLEQTRQALELGQVEELVIAAVSEAINAGPAPISEEDAGAERTTEERVADELIVKARETAASVRFIQDRALLEPVGGVGAFLRFKL